MRPSAVSASSPHGLDDLVGSYHIVEVLSALWKPGGREYTCRLKEGQAIPAQSGTQVLDRAVHILETIARHGQIALTPLSSEVRLPLSTTQRIVTSLAAHGLVEQTKPGGRYILGGRLQLFASQVDSGRNLRSLARPIMEQLMADTQEDVFLAVLRDQYAVIIERLVGPKALKIVEPPGEVAVTLNCGFRRVLLAYQPQQFIDEYLSNTTFVRYTEHTITDRRELRKNLEKVRELGYAVSSGESVPEAAGIAAPVFGASGEIVATLFIVGPTVHFTKQFISKRIPKVVQAAQKLTNVLRGESQLTE